MGEKDKIDKKVKKIKKAGYILKGNYIFKIIYIKGSLEKSYDNLRNVKIKLIIYYFQRIKKLTPL